MVEIALGLMFGLILGTVMMNNYLNRVPLTASTTPTEMHSSVLFTEPNYDKCSIENVCQQTCVYMDYGPCDPNCDQIANPGCIVNCNGGWWMTQDRSSQPTGADCVTTGLHLACNSSPGLSADGADCICHWQTGPNCPCCNQDTQTCGELPWSD
jgi:hypothetical protein